MQPWLITIDIKITASKCGRAARLTWHPRKKPRGPRWNCGPHVIFVVGTHMYNPGRRISTGRGYPKIIKTRAQLCRPSPPSSPFLYLFLLPLLDYSLFQVTPFFSIFYLLVLGDELRFLFICGCYIALLVKELLVLAQFWCWWVCIWAVLFFLTSCLCVWRSGMSISQVWESWEVLSS